MGSNLRRLSRHGLNTGDPIVLHEPPRKALVLKQQHPWHMIQPPLSAYVRLIQDSHKLNSPNVSWSNYQFIVICPRVNLNKRQQSVTPLASNKAGLCHYRRGKRASIYSLNNTVFVLMCRAITMGQIIWRKRRFLFRRNQKEEVCFILKGQSDISLRSAQVSKLNSTSEMRQLHVFSPLVS